MKPRILLVDDDTLLLRSLNRILREEFEITTAESGEEALKVLFGAEPFAVVVADMKMPGMDGIKFLDQWRFLAPNTTRVMLTGQADLSTAIDAVNQGHVFRFLTKPIKGDDLRLVLVDSVNQHELIVAERTLLEQTLTGSVQTLVELLSLFDPRGFGRTKEMRDLAVEIAGKFSLDVGWDLGLAALLSRIGWLAIPVEVQSKIVRGERLTVQENEMALRAPEVGANIIANIPRLQSVARLIRYSTKHFDGTGYPAEHIAGEDIPIGSRILLVVHDYVTRLQVRQSKVVVFSEIEAASGSKYDPAVVKILGEVVHAVGANEAEKHVMLALEDLQPGMVLADDVFVKNNDVVILTMGTRLNLLHIEKLRNYAVGTSLANPILINRTV